MVFTTKSRRNQKYIWKKPFPIPMDRFSEKILASLLNDSEKFLNRSEGGGNKLYSENHAYFLNIIAMICKNKYSAFGNIQTMV